MGTMALTSAWNYHCSTGVCPVCHHRTEMTIMEQALFFHEPELPLHEDAIFDPAFLGNSEHLHKL